MDKPKRFLWFTQPSMLGAALICFGALWGAWSTMDRYFVGDDFAYIQRFSRLPMKEWGTLFWRDWSGGIWGFSLPELRPFAGLTFLIEHRLWGINPLGFHLTNFVLHAGCGILVMQLTRFFFPVRPGIAFWAGLLFVLHAAHAESVAWITGRVDVLATLGYLSGLWAAVAYLKNSDRLPLGLAWLAFFVGVFSKEFSLTLPLMVVFAVAVYGGGWKGVWRRFAVLISGYIVVVILYGFCRSIAFESATKTTGTLSLLEFGTRQYEYLAWMFPPFYSPMQSARAATDTLAPWVFPMSMLGFAAVAIFWRFRKPENGGWRAVLYFGVLWYLVATLPLVVVSYFSPRHLFLATAGLCIALAVCVGSVVKRPWISHVCLGLLCWLFAFRYDAAIKPWRHSAKISEAVTDRVVETSSHSAPETLLILDVPDVYEGVWMWSWALPHALQEPFVNRLGAQVLASPRTYYAPHLWPRHVVETVEQTYVAVIRIYVGPNGKIASDKYALDAFRRALPRLVSPPDGETQSTSWDSFIASLCND